MGSLGLPEPYRRIREKHPLEVPYRTRGSLYEELEQQAIRDLTEGEFGRLFEAVAAANRDNLSWMWPVQKVLAMALTSERWGPRFKGPSRDQAKDLLQAVLLRPSVDYETTVQVAMALMDTNRALAAEALSKVYGKVWVEVLPYEKFHGTLAGPQLRKAGIQVPDEICQVGTAERMIRLVQADLDKEARLPEFTSLEQMLVVQEAAESYNNRLQDLMADGNLERLKELAGSREKCARLLAKLYVARLEQ